VTVTRRDKRPGETFLGGKGVVVFRGLKRKTRKPDDSPQPPEDSTGKFTSKK